MLPFSWMKKKKRTERTNREMKRDCQYCAAPFSSERASRKYCSDNCKQMVYFIRNGLVLSGVSETAKVKYETPLSVKDLAKNDSVKYPTEIPTVKYAKDMLTVKDAIPISVKYPPEILSVKDTMQPDEKPVSVKSDTLTINDKALDTIINRLT